MNWIKQNKKLATILGVMVAGGIGLGVWLYMAWSDYSDQMEEWAKVDKSTTTLENAKIYPSEANMKSLKEKIDDYREKFDNLQTVLLSKGLQEEVTPMSETEFQSKLKERSRTVTQKAGKQGTQLPKDFALAFDEYTVSLPPNADVAADLNVQLDATEKFVNALLDAGVKSIDSLERTRLPTERGGVATVKAPPPPPTPTNKNKKGAAPMIPQGAPVLDRYTLKCTFTCDSGPLQNAMNNLANPAKIPDFLAVRQLHVENAKQEAPTKEEIKNLISKPDPNAPVENNVPAPKPVANAPRLVPVVKPAKPDSAEIMGGEDLKVYMEVDYIRFRKPPADAAAVPAPTAKK